MSQWLNWGNGSDGAATLSGTDAPIDSSCSGSSGSTSLTATNASFAAGQQILIHKTRGNTTTNAGTWEVNYIASYSAGTITTLLPLVNSYQDSGADQSQVLVLKQYSGVTISGTLTAKAWDGDVGGIIALICGGQVNITGTISASGVAASGGSGGTGIGFSGHNAEGDNPGHQGDSTTGVGVKSASANGMGGGGANGDSDSNSGGGGGGHATTGDTGGVTGGGSGGPGGGTGGAADLTTMVFGGAGGSSWGSNAGSGGGSGGIILIFSRTIMITGAITASGGAGSTAGTGQAGGGGGAGGSILIKTQSATLGTNLITATGGAGGAGSLGIGGNGSGGRIRIEACSRTGSTNPGASEQIGGFNFCGSAAAIVG